MGRYAEVTRKTGETDIVVKLDLDGTGTCDISTGVPFFDHMLNAFGRHGLFDLTVHAVGDVEVDAHHTVEDTGIVLGEAFCRALGGKAGITRFADAAIAMDETLVMAAVDISGRGQAYCELPVPTERVGSFDTELAVEFFYAFARDGYRGPARGGMAERGELCARAYAACHARARAPTRRVFDFGARL